MTVRKHEYLQAEDYYESRGVGTKARSSKTCVHCHHVIPKGEPHTVHTFYPEFTAYPTHKHCNEDFRESLRTPEDDREIEEASADYIKVINDALENDELVYTIRDYKATKLYAVKHVKDTLNIGLKQAKEIVDRVFEIYK